MKYKIYREKLGNRSYALSAYVYTLGTENLIPRRSWIEQTYIDYTKKESEALFLQYLTKIGAESADSQLFNDYSRA